VRRNEPILRILCRNVSLRPVTLFITFIEKVFVLVDSPKEILRQTIDFLRSF